MKLGKIQQWLISLFVGLSVGAGGMYALHGGPDVVNTKDVPRADHAVRVIDKDGNAHIWLLASSRPAQEVETLKGDK